MKISSFARIASVTLLSSQFAFGQTPAKTYPAKSSHESLFAKESTPLIFTVETGKDTERAPPLLSLLQVDAAGKRIKYLGILTDDGVMGDRQPRDGIFSRKVAMSEKKADQLYFAVVDDPAGDGAKSVEQVDVAHMIQVNVIMRPSFIQMVSRAWELLLRGFTRNHDSPAA